MEEKECCKCGFVKLMDDFFKNKRNRDGYCYQCKDCFREYEQTSERKAYMKAYEVKESEVKERRCCSCKKVLSIDSFHKVKNEVGGHGYVCKSCIKERRKLPRSRFLDYRSNAKCAGRAFELTYEKFLELWNNTCFYCGDIIDGIGIDRISSDGGYTIDNIVPCCAFCNRMKLNHGLDVFYKQVEKIYKNLKQKQKCQQ